MSVEISETEWIALAKQEFAKQGVTGPDDEELWVLAYMECRSDGLSIEEYTRQQKELQG